MEIKQRPKEIFEREVLPKEVEEKMLPVEERGTISYSNIKEAEKELSKGAVFPSVEIRSVEKEVIEKPPIIKEYITKRELEVIQPVIHREVIQQHETLLTKPIHEKIIEAPVIIKEEAEVIDLRPKEERREFRKEHKEVREEGFKFKEQKEWKKEGSRSY
jgi:hypothetical protein